MLLKTIAKNILKRLAASKSGGTRLKKTELDAAHLLAASGRIKVFGSKKGFYAWVVR